MQALNEIGAPEYAAVLSRAIELFPARQIPRDIDKRNTSLDSLPYEAHETMETLDDEFYSLGDDELFDRLLKFWKAG